MDAEGLNHIPFESQPILMSNDVSCWQFVSIYMVTKL